MHCEICGTDPEVIVLLPIKKHDGCLETLVCEACAEKSPAYCLAHCRPHLGFEDDTHACIICIEEEVKRLEECAESYHDRIYNALPPDEREELEGWTSLVGNITGDADETCVLRAIVTRAMRSGATPDSVIETVIREKSVASILPRIMT